MTLPWVLLTSLTAIVLAAALCWSVVAYAARRERAHRDRTRERR